MGRKGGKRGIIKKQAFFRIPLLLFSSFFSLIIILFLFRHSFPIHPILPSHPCLPPLPSISSSTHHKSTNSSPQKKGESDQHLDSLSLSHTHQSSIVRSSIVLSLLLLNKCKVGLFKGQLQSREHFRELVYQHTTLQ